MFHILNDEVDLIIFYNILDTEGVILVGQTYDIPESDVKLNDIVEFVGILTYEAESTVNDDENTDEEASVRLPSGMVMAP